MFREEPRRVLDFLDEAERADGQQTWRVAFMRATALLLLGKHDEAIRTLRAAEELGSTPEGANNLGVALARAGRLEEARCAFSLSVSQRPDYEDARINLTADVPTRITTHPLR
jgi:Flp pilus assembly protein TadD